MNGPPASPRPRRSACQLPLAVLGLAVAIALQHGASIHYGLFLDDYAHFQQLREAGWSLRELTDACRLELVGGTIELWWLPDCTLRFFRPLAFGLMKTVYTLSGWSPAAQHVASLFWHLAACTLLMLLLEQIGIRRLAAWTTAVLFAIHPAHVTTVQWIAAQTELMATTFVLASVWSFAHFRGWHAPAGTRARDASAEPGPALAGGILSHASARPRPAWALASVVCYVLALGCRENAIVLPVMLLLVDVIVARPTLRRAVPAYVGLGVVTLAYLAVRSFLLDGVALPPRPYVVPPTDPDFVRFVFDKACYYLLGEFLLYPCVPLGGLAYLRDHPLLFYLPAAVVAAALIGLTIYRRQALTAALAWCWLTLFMLPVLPTFESPHHLYLPGVGWALFVALGLQRRRGHERRPSRPVMIRRGVFALGTAGLFATVSYFCAMTLDTGRSIEDRVVAEIVEAPHPVHDGDTLYIANLPVLAHYVKLAVQQRAGVRDLRVVGLTWAPRLLGVVTPSELRRVDERTIEVVVAGDRFFSGPMGRLVRESNGVSAAELLREPIHEPGFTVELLEADDAGISALRFRFDERLDRPNVHLFWGSRARWAYQVRDLRPVRETP